jgi:hypothetical protein
MALAQTATAIAIELLCGAAGALAVRWRHRAPRLGVAATAVIGMIGGFVFTLLAAHVPGIGRFVGHVENTADSVMHGIGGLTPAILIGVGISGLLGGAILAFVIFRNARSAGRWQA